MSMHIHILGICGTFMGGIAMIARQAGFKVTGADQNVYPPMSEELQKAGIEIYQGYDAKQLDLRPDLIVVGNVMRRGMPVIERMLNENFPYVSGPGWLEEHYLKQKCVLAVAGTHGKTTTSAMLTWILDVCGKNPGFLIGGIPGNYGISARNTDSPYFVIEADEYDCAFFDKRSKFVHYHPQALIINNIEYDHADIFDSVRDIERQFHHLVRTIPSKGLVVAPRADKNVRDALAMGCWTPVVTTGLSDADWSYKMLREDGTEFCILHKGAERAHVNFACTGEYNVKNALNAVVAAGYCGIDPEAAAAALSSFVLPKRRMELKGEACGVSVYDDFAHHPTAVRVTLHGMREHLGREAHIIAVFEPRSNSMRMGANHEALAASFCDADETFIYAPSDLAWNAEALAGEKIRVVHDFDALINEICQSARKGSTVIVMSNGSFNGIHAKILNKLKARSFPPLTASGK
mgnify:CR=1 FL=1